MFDRANRAWNRIVTPTTSELFYSAESLARRKPVTDEERLRAATGRLAKGIWEAAHDLGIPLNFKQADALAAEIVRKEWR